MAENHTYLLTKAAEVRNRAEAALTDHVILARINGLTWTEIGVILGLTKQGARQKYGHLVNETVVRERA